MVLGKNGSSDIKTIIIKMIKTSHLYPEKVLMTIFPDVLSQILRISGLRNL